MGLRKIYIIFQIAAIVLLPLILKAQSGQLNNNYLAIHDGKKLNQQLPVSSITDVDERTKNNIGNSVDDLLAETNGLSEAKINQKFSRVLKGLKITDIANQDATDRRMFIRMADLFARLKLYPLAMKCYLKTLPVVSPGLTSAGCLGIDTVRKYVRPIIASDSTSENNEALNLTLRDDSVFGQKTKWLQNHANEKRSKAVSSQDITAAFNDGKTGIAYALLFHVKQPVPGKRKVFHWINTGHTYITLIKYNDDSTCVVRSFGFYPQKDNILSATPLLPSTSSTFKDDAGHNWDELVGKFISRHKFKRILKLVGQFSETDYQLSANNCTDFAISAATIAGIYINNTKAKWPLGKGNNPGSTGQSIIAGQISTNDHIPLFIYKNINETLTAQ